MQLPYVGPPPGLHVAAIPHANRLYRQARRWRQRQGRERDRCLATSAWVVLNEYSAPGAGGQVDFAPGIAPELDTASLTSHLQALQFENERLQGELGRARTGLPVIDDTPLSVLGIVSNDVRRAIACVCLQRCLRGCCVRRRLRSQRAAARVQKWWRDISGRGRRGATSASGNVASEDGGARPGAVAAGATFDAPLIHRTTCRNFF